jgi:DNA-binding CsgD family transcriptional regulator
MVRLSQVQQRARQRITQLADRCLLTPELGAEIVEALSGAIPNDGYRLMGIDPSTRFINRVLAASENDGWARHSWFQDAYLASDPLTYVEPPNLMRWRLVSVAVQERQEQCWGFPKEMLAQLSSQEHYNGFYENQCPIGGTLIGTFSAAGQWIATLQLYRREPNAPLRRTDVDFLKLLSPTIGQLLSRALGFERALIGGDTAGPDSSGILIVGHTGEIRFMTPAGESWLRLLREADVSHSRSLPTAIWSALAGMKAAEPSRRAKFLIAPTAAGAVRLEAAPAGSDGSVAFVLTRQRRPSRVELPHDWPLTRQEREVAILILLGLTNREIAERLFVTENTVQTHIRHIYEKLDVSRRTQLSARFFRDAYLPDLLGGASG